MSQEHRSEGRKVHEVDSRTRELERRLNRMCRSFTAIGMVISLGSFSFDLIAPMFQIRISEGMGWQQGMALGLGVIMIYVGLITGSKK